MKKISAVLTIILCAALSSHADTVSQNRAASVAKAFFSASSTRGSNALVTLVWDGSDALTKASDTPAFYVYNNAGGGFVIISAEDAALPVLGYSETGSFKVANLPANAKWWFDSYRRQIQYLRDSDIAQTPEVRALWDNVASEIQYAAGEVRLNTATWDQAAPFNNLLPTIDGAQAITGCVCTATCEIMKYHQWPSKGRGTLPDYTYKTDKSGRNFTQPGHELTATYDWSSMPDSYTRYNSVQANQVAQLMFDVGVMLQSNFNGEDYGTGAYDSDVIPMLVKYMDYDPSAVFLYREDYGDTRWASMMRSELDAGRPMLYSGEGDYGGHAFVVDGYKANNYFYVNWGWGGMDNGWYALSSFMIDSDYDFRYGQTCSFGIRKNEGGKPVDIVNFIEDSGKAGISITSGSIGTSSFTMNTGYVINSGTDTLKAEFAFALVDKYGNIKEVISTPSKTTVSPGYYFSKSTSCRLSSSANSGLQFGDAIVVCFRKDGGDWTKVTGAATFTGVEAYAVYDVPFIDVNAAASYTAGEMIPLKLINYRKKPKSVKWYVDGTLYKDVDMVLPSGTHTVKCVAAFSDRTETLVQQITVN